MAIVKLTFRLALLFGASRRCSPQRSSMSLFWDKDSSYAQNILGGPCGRVRDFF